MKCKKCGKTETPENYGNEKELKTNKLCFDCNYWYTKVKALQNNDHNLVIYKSNVYYIGPKTSDPPKYRGHGGSYFFGTFKNGRQIKTNNMWYNGEIPEHWKSELPDNCVTLKRQW